MEIFQKRSKQLAIIGVLLAFLPFYFVLAMLSKYNLGIEFLYTPWGYILDHPTLGKIFNDISPFLFGGGLLLAFGLNLLPFLQMSFNREGGEVTAVVTIKTKLWNLLLVSVTGLVGFIMLSYLVVENIIN